MPHCSSEASGICMDIYNRSKQVETLYDKARSLGKILGSY